MTNSLTRETRPLTGFPEPVEGKLIWPCPLPWNNSSRVPVPGRMRLEFPDLSRFQGHWYCGFREADIHENHPSGKGRIIRSADGAHWETVKIIAWPGADAGTPRFSVTAEGWLMVNAWFHFVSREPRADGYYYQLARETLGLGLTPHSDREADAASQSLTWQSADGLDWSSAYACPSGINTTRFQVTWHEGMGYSVANALGKNIGGTLYRTRDGKTWRVLKESFIPPDQADEAALAFTPDGTACCLLRGSSRTIALLGRARPPYYQDWQWLAPSVDWRGDGIGRPVSEVFRVQLGGPKLIRLADGRLLGAGRTLPPERPDGPWRVDPGDPQGKEDGRVVLFLVDPEKGMFTRFAEMDGTSYPGVAEYDGRVWVSYIVWWGDRPGVYLASIKAT